MYFALNLGTESINFVSTCTDLSTYNIVGYGLCSDSFVKKNILTGAGMTLPFPVGKWKGLVKDSASTCKYCELLKLVVHEIL